MISTENLRKLREARGLTCEELGNKVGVSFGAVAAWETRGIFPRADKLPALADALGVSIDQLFGRETIISKNGG